jgi:GNAT superfamily N-acetyltransferase
MGPAAAMTANIDGERQITIRSHIRPGDIGRITALHGLVYATEYGWDHTFEAYVAEYLAPFARRYGGNARERIWVAERGEDIVACVAIVEATGNDAQLRWFLVHGSARGRGLGREMLHHAIAFCRHAGYRRIILDTVSDLTAAAALYSAAGFRVISEETAAGWGAEVLAQRYELELDS